MKKILLLTLFLFNFHIISGLTLQEQINILASFDDGIPTYLVLDDTIINIKLVSDKFKYQRILEYFKNKKGVGGHYENGFITIRCYKNASKELLTSLYIHERQHYLNQTTYKWYAYFKCISKDELFKLIGKFCTNPNYYKEQGHYSMADEFVAYLVTEAYRKKIDLIECCNQNNINDDRVLIAVKNIAKPYAKLDTRHKRDCMGN